MRAAIVGFIALGLGGCASTQLNYNSLDIASTYDELLSKQVTYNLRKFIANEYAIPAIAKITNSTVVTQRSISPSLTLPFTSTVTNTLAQAAAGITNTRTIMGPGNSSGISGTDQDNQNYTLALVYDPDQLRRVQTLYRFVTKKIYSDEFEISYPIIETAGASSSSSSPSLSLTLTVAGKPITVSTAPSAQKKNSDEIVYVRRTALVRRDGALLPEARYTWAIVKPDLTFIKQPGCVLCDYQKGLTMEETADVENSTYVIDQGVMEAVRAGRKIHKLQRNYQITNNWLYLPDEPMRSDAIPLPSNEMQTLYVKGTAGQKRFSELVLFTEEATTQGTGSPASAGQSDGRKTSPLERVSAPVSGGTIVP